jgi:hypothetical protein
MDEDVKAEIEGLQRAHHTALAEIVADKALGDRSFKSTTARNNFIREILPAVSSAKGTGLFQGQSLKDYAAGLMTGELSYMCQEGAGASSRSQSGKKVPSLDDIRPGMSAEEMERIQSHIKGLIAARGR